MAAQPKFTGVYGKVTDLNSGLPLEGANLRVEKGDSLLGTSTDVSGTFKLALPTGRYLIICSFQGYADYTHEILVIAGKETYLSVQLVPGQTTLSEVTIVSGSGNSTGDLSIPIEKTLRVPANFFDPVRMATSYPGIAAANDQANALIINGQGPAGLNWRLNGLEVVNPNHLANAGTLSDLPISLGGGVNIVSAQMLDRTTIYSGFTPSKFGNATSGILDLNYRPGTSQRNYTLQASLIGLDAAAEGSLGKKSTYLVNYRYSTLGLLSALGVPLGDEKINFQDLSWNLNSQISKSGEVSFFGFAGSSTNKFDGKDSVDIVENKDRFKIGYDALTYAAGVEWKQTFKRGLLRTAILLSATEQNRKSNSINSLFNADDFLLRSETFSSRRELVSATSSYTHTFTSGSLEAGLYINGDNFVVEGTEAIGEQGALPVSTFDVGVQTSLIQPYLQGTFQIGYKTTLSPGLRLTGYNASGEWLAEPAIKLTNQLGATTVVLSWSKASQQLPAMIRIYKSDLELMRNTKYQVSASRAIRGYKVKADGYYQLNTQVPILGVWSFFNWLEERPPVGFSAEGKSRTYGLNLVAEKAFIGGYYLMTGGSVYNAAYNNGDDVWKAGRFNGGYSLNVLAGKEWSKDVKVRGLNVRMLYLGGMRQPGIDETASEAIGRTVYDYSADMKKFNDYFRIDARYSIRKNKEGYTRTLALEIQNLFNIQNQGWYAWDAYQKKVVLKNQLGIIPVLIYKVEF